MSKSLLIDILPFEVTSQQINESMTDNHGRLVVSGVLQRANSKNQNGRIYPKEVLIREAKKYTKEFIKQSRALGELDHPESSVVNLRNTSHNVKEMWWEGDNLLGKVEVLSTPTGNILKELFKARIKLGISSRGLGSVESAKDDDTQEVQKDFELIAFDFVSNPSTHGAFMHPMTEGVIKENTRNDGTVCDKWCRTEAIISDILTGI
jgi:hypothetical protein|tara:strand:- start:1006 stop:1626 length:621 start_codon:yes stop_codon:yes gene_type:complete